MPTPDRGTVPELPGVSNPIGEPPGHLVPRPVGYPRQKADDAAQLQKGGDRRIVGDEFGDVGELVEIVGRGERYELLKGLSCETWIGEDFLVGQQDPFMRDGRIEWWPARPHSTDLSGQLDRSPE